MSGRSAESALGRAAALAALLLILITTAVWWALALWPLSTDAPAWLVRTRAVCFGAAPQSLPDAAGWVALLLQPTLMVGILLAVWGREVRAGTRALARGWTGRAALGVIAAALLVGAVGAGTRVVTAARRLEAAATNPASIEFARLDREAPTLALTDQHGQRLSLERFRGRPVLVTFAFAHCETVCPLVVTEVLRAQRRFATMRGGSAADEAAKPGVVVITLDPWRDTPRRLAHIAGAWGVGAGAHVLSGTPEAVNRALDAWQVPRDREGSTGDIVHPALVYVVDSAGRIAYSATGNAELLVQLLVRAS